MNRFLKLIPLVAFALTNYQLAKLLASNFNIPVGFEYLIFVIWIIPALVILTISKSDVFKLNINKISKNKTSLLKLLGVVLLGFLIFWFLGLTKYFHSVQYPILFYLGIPIIEELIFRGVIYDQINKYKLGNPIVISSILFALHHLQYYNYHLGIFPIFQVIYTFIAGLLLAKIRKDSGSIYLSIITHILINLCSYLL